MDPTAVPAPLHVQAFFWTLSPQEKEIKDSFKVKCCDVHPELPLVLSADKSGQIQVWDMFKHSLLMNCSVADMVTATDRAKYANADERNRKVKEVGAVHAVRFVDNYALCWATGKPPVDISVTTFNNDTRVMVLCEGGLLFYDYASGMAHMLTQLELGKPATAAEFLAPNMCAIGCSDGQIRVWDCLSWSACKELSGHTKGNIIWLRMLSPKSYNPSPCADNNSRVSFDGSSAVGRGSADFSVTSLLSTVGSRVKDEKPRLFSVGYDGGALLWDICVSDGTVSVVGGSPAGHLLSLGCFAQYFDENSDTLYTVSADRTVRLWDLANIGKGATGGVVRSARRRSSFLGTAAGTEAGKISCVGKAKPRADLSSSIAKFNSCTPLEHPRFPGGTFAVSAKSNTIGIVQVYESFGEEDAVSERSSVTNSDSAAMKYHELHLFQMTSVLTATLVQLHEANPDMPISSAVISACRDTHSLKVYSVQSHLSYPHILVACTNVGVVALSLCAPSKAGGEGSRIGTHPTWGQNIVTFSDHNIKYSAMRVAKSLTGATGQAGTPSRPRSLRRRHTSRSMGGSTDLTNVTVSEDGVVLEPIADFTPSAAPVVPGGSTMPVGLDTSTRGRTSSLVTQAIRNCNLAVLSSRPVFYSSCSGLFCAAFWPESCIYVVLKVGLSDITANAADSASGTPTRRSFSRNGSSSTTGGEKMVEVERGMCYSLGWCAAANASGETGDVSADILCLITPAKRINAPKKRNSIVGVFASKKKESDAVLPSDLVLKRIHADLQVTEVLPDGAPKYVSEVIGGGAFICLTTPIASQSGGGKKAVSQIELEAQAEERARSRTASTAGLERAGVVEDNTAYSNIAPITAIYKSQFFRVVYGVKDTESQGAIKPDPAKPAEASGTPGHEATLKIPPSPQPKLYLEPVGPSFQKILSISWDLVSGHAALTMEATNRITVVSCVSAKPCPPPDDDPETAQEASLSVVGSIQLSDGSSPPPLRCKTQSISWSNGSLFVASPSAIHVVFLIGGGASRTQLKAYPVCTLHRIMSDPTRAKSYFGAMSPQRPFGWLQCVSVSAGHLVVASQAGSLSAIPLTWSPVVAVGLVCGAVKYMNKTLELSAVLPWVDTVPPALRHELLPLLEPIFGDDDWDLTFGAASPKHIFDMLKEYSATCSPAVVLYQHFLGDPQAGCIYPAASMGPGRMSYLDSVLFALGQTLMRAENSMGEEGGAGIQDARDLVRMLADWSSHAGAGMSQTEKLSIESIASVVARGTQCSLADDIRSRMAAIVANASGSDRTPAATMKVGHLPSGNVDSSALFDSDLGITKFKIVA